MACFLFYGEDLYSLRKKVDFWKTEFTKKHGGDTNIETLEGANLTIDQFVSAVTTPPFLGEKRLTIIKNFLREGDKEIQKIVSAHIENCADFCVLVFMEEGAPDQRLSLFKKLQKTGKTEEFTLKSGAALLSALFKLAKEKGAEIEENAAIFLAELTGGNLYRLENEIHKLAHFALNRPITREDVSLLADTTIDTSIFRLTDALGNGNQKLSLQILQRLLDSGEDLHHTLYMIVRQFRIITQVKELAENGLRKAAIAEKIKEHPYVCGLAMAQANNFSFEKLREIYKTLLSMDLKLKTGGIKILTGDPREFVLAITKFIIDACNKKSPATAN